MKFWVDNWQGLQSLIREFPLVFSLVANPQVLVSEHLDVRHGSVGWYPILRRLAFDWEVPAITSLLGRLYSCKAISRRQENLTGWF